MQASVETTSDANTSTTKLALSNNAHQKPKQQRSERKREFVLFSVALDHVTEVLEEEETIRNWVNKL